MPSEIIAILKGRARAVEAAFERSRRLSHEQAALTAYAYHDPKKMPPYKPLGATSATKVAAAKAAPNSTVEQIRARGHLIRLAMSSRARKPVSPKG